MYDIIFVILIYNLYDEVQKCIASIRKRIDTDSYHFVIVDNGSSNGVGRRLRKKYEGDETVHVLLLEENLGFARGNNAGIALARDLGAKFICCLNDDTRLLSPRLVATLEEKYAQYQSAVIGPRVLERDVNESAFNHRLSAATLHSFKKRKEAWAFRKKHMIESRRILIAYLKAHRDEIYPR